MPDTAADGAPRVPDVGGHEPDGASYAPGQQPGGGTDRLVRRTDAVLDTRDAADQQADRASLVPDAVPDAAADGPPVQPTRAAARSTARPTFPASGPTAGPTARRRG